MGAIKSDLQHKSAPKSTVESFFKVVQTGKNPKHHTVVLPKPVTSKVTEQINEIFKPVPLEQIFKQNKK